ncbi:MAG: metallophosphoesterase [Roseococcus sp.]|nr:metallophosphoesterase [Roseococcus sp.]
MSLTPALLRARGFTGLRVVGDVHGDSAAFAAALEGARSARRFVLQLGDLTDYGPDAPGALRLAFAMQDAGEGVFLLGNHDHKLRRALAGARVRVAAEGLGRTLDQLALAADGEALAAEALRRFADAPAWLRIGPWFFVHAAFHPAMLVEASPEAAGRRRPDGPLARALYGQVTGRTGADGFPERVLHWLDQVPAGITVYCGHDQRSQNGRPLPVKGRLGGMAVFLDTGAGKGGHLSWLDLPFPG